jgi:hypothetical protein
VKIPGIHCENTRRIVHRAIDKGWTFDGKTKSNHGILTWPATEQQLHFGFTPSDRNAWKKLAVDIETVSGVVVWQRTKHGAAHRRPSSTPETARVQRERERFAAAADAEAGRRMRARAAEVRERELREITYLMRP